MEKKYLNLKKAQDNALAKLNADIETANKLWFGAIRLIITLASSFLLLTLAVADNLFPEILIYKEISGFLISAWVLLFLSIIFGIITELEASIFFGNSCRATDSFLNRIDQKIANGLEEDYVDLPKSYLKNAPILWGAICINFFIISVVCLCISFFENGGFEYSNYILCGSILLIVLLNIYLITKRHINNYN